MYYFIPSWSGSEERIWHRDIIPWYHSMQRLEFNDTIHVQWYLNNKTWWQNVLNGSYRLERLGTGK